MTETVTLYKYTSVSSALKILSTGKFAFRHPSFFNDPFDGHISDVTNFDAEYFKKAFYLEAERLIVSNNTENVATPNSDLAELIEKCREKAKQSIPQALDLFKEHTAEGIISVIDNGILHFANSEWRHHMTQMRILCLSEINDSVLMWSHYADAHRGVVIEVEVPRERLEKIEYPKSYPIHIQPADFWVKRQFGTAEMDPNILFTSQLATKSHHWEYEKEWRCIIAAREDGADPHFAEVGDITGVYFGCNCTNIDQVALSNIVDALHPHVKVYKGELQKYNYGLKFKEENATD